MRIGISLLLGLLTAMLMMSELSSWAQDAPVNSMDIMHEKVCTDRKTLHLTVPGLDGIAGQRVLAVAARHVNRLVKSS